MRSRALTSGIGEKQFVGVGFDGYANAGIADAAARLADNGYWDDASTSTSDGIYISSASDANCTCTANYNVGLNLCNATTSVLDHDPHLSDADAAAMDGVTSVVG